MSEIAYFLCFYFYLQQQNQVQSTMDETENNSTNFIGNTKQEATP